jgi:hypothetical protein
MQIETMLAEGIVLAILFFDKTDEEREAALLQSCFLDELRKRNSLRLRRRAPDDDVEE